MAGITHWLEWRYKVRKPEHEHINRIRISADATIKLIGLKNKLLGTKRSIYEESMRAEELAEN